MTVTVYIISLLESQQRRSALEEQAEKIGFSPVWHSAVSGESIPDADYIALAFDWQRPLIKNEVGCFLSHLQLWQTIADGATPAVILEDDVLLAPNFPEVLKCLSTFEGADLINLEAVGKKILGPKIQYKGVQVHKLALNSSGAGAYLLWPQGARKLIKNHQKKGVVIVDAFINESRNLRSWQISPAVCIQDCMFSYYNMPNTQNLKSIIARDDHVLPKAPNINTVVLMKFRRLYGEIVKGLLRLLVFVGYSRTFVPYLNYRRYR